LLGSGGGAGGVGVAIAAGAGAWLAEGDGVAPCVTGCVEAPGTGCARAPPEPKASAVKAAATPVKPTIFLNFRTMNSLCSTRGAALRHIVPSPAPIFKRRTLPGA